MASKEATVYVVDCGHTMGDQRHDRQQTNLDWALEYIWDKITTTVATGRKTALIGVVGFGTLETSNELGSEPEYQSISVLQDLIQVQMPHLRKLQGQLVVNPQGSGDAISALVIAIQMIARTCKKLQYVRKIVLVTDGKSPIQADELSQIASKIKDDNIELVVLGVDFDDPSYGFKESVKDPLKAENETIFKTLCEGCNGTLGTLAQAIEELQIPRTKTTRPVHSYRGFLTLGNPEDYETALTIEVERYPKVMVASAPTASRYIVKKDSSSSDPTSLSANWSTEQASTADELAAVQNARTYQIEDTTVVGGKREVPFDDLAKGYEYGRTAVHISESDRNVTTYETLPGLDIIGFVDSKQYERYLDMSKTCMIVANPSNDKASMALSALIHGLYELDSFAVARYVAKENKEPKILLLAPNIEPEFECLYDVEVPFAEDVRPYKFPPLDRVVTVSGKVLELHRNLPSRDLQTAMNAYVDVMNLAEFNDESSDEKFEYGSMDETFSPVLHRINQVIRYRAVHPTSSLPDPAKILTKYSHPPNKLVVKAEKYLNEMAQFAEVKTVPPKARGKRYGRKGREHPKPLSELDVGALLANDPRRKSKKIDPKNAIAEYKQILASAEEISEVKSASVQLGNIIFDWIRYSVGDSGYGRAVEALRVMREELSEMEEPQQYNEYLKDLKAKLLDGDLDGDRRDMWWRIRLNKLGPITRAELESSEMTEEAARLFMTSK